jgi:hypothetical protein
VTEPLHCAVLIDYRASASSPKTSPRRRRSNSSPLSTVARGRRANCKQWVDITDGGCAPLPRWQAKAIVVSWPPRPKPSINSCWRAMCAFPSSTCRFDCARCSPSVPRSIPHYGPTGAKFCRSISKFDEPADGIRTGCGDILKVAFYVNIPANTPCQMRGWRRSEDAGDLARLAKM